MAKGRAFWSGGAAPEKALTCVIAKRGSVYGDTRQGPPQDLLKGIAISHAGQAEERVCFLHNWWCLCSFLGTSGWPLYEADGPLVKWPGLGL